MKIQKVGKKKQLPDVKCYLIALLHQAMSNKK